jgi:hypothetical protein
MDSGFALRAPRNDGGGFTLSWRAPANGPRECAPDDRLRNSEMSQMDYFVASAFVTADKHAPRNDKNFDGACQFQSTLPPPADWRGLDAETIGPRDTPCSSRARSRSPSSLGPGFAKRYYAPHRIRDTRRNDSRCLTRLSPRQSDLPVVPTCRSSPTLRASPNQTHRPRHPAPAGGAFRDRHGRWARDAVDAFGARDECTDKRTAKSCGPDASTLASSGRRCFVSWPAMVTRKPDHQGEREGNR